MGNFKHKQKYREQDESICTHYSDLVIINSEPIPFLLCLSLLTLPTLAYFEANPRHSILVNISIYLCKGEEFFINIPPKVLFCDTLHTNELTDVPCYFQDK